jgi:hypothetical protein
MSTPSSYRRVAQRDDPTGGGGTESGGGGGSSSSGGGGVDTFDVPVRSRKDRLEDKCVALGWIIVSCIVERYTDFFSIVLLWNNTYTDIDIATSQPNKVLLRIAYIGFSIVITLYLYLTIYLPKVKGLPSNDPSVWTAYCPKVLPIMGVTGIMTYLILIRALYPIYGMLGPIISGTEIMGLVMATHFIPVFGLC